MRYSDFLPPILVSIGRKLINGARASQRRLFDGDEQMFIEQAQKATCYGEYGMGASTRWVSRNTHARVISVDTAQAWVEQVSNDVPAERLDCKWIDVGPVGDWGWPKSYARRSVFREYIDYPWSKALRPDLVLVDGRFRVACFLNSLLLADPGARIIFDDYADRERYHVVEEVLRPAQTCGRQRLFVVPSDFDRDLARDLLARFEYVMD